LSRRLAATSMAPIRRFSVVEKGKTPREEPGPLPPKKRLGRPHDTGEGQGVTWPWYERPPPGFPLPLYAHAQGSGQGGNAQCRAGRGLGGQTEAARAGVLADGPKLRGQQAGEPMARGPRASSWCGRQCRRTRGSGS
jgi:hypothetical protein